MRTAFCFDLDGTVTKTEILPCIASELGIADEIAVLTKATMDGLIPFEASFRLRCLVLGQIPADTVRAIVAAIPLDGHVLEFIRSNRDNCYLVTGNLDTWIEPIVLKCGCAVYSSTAELRNGRLQLRHVIDKAEAISDLRAGAHYDRIVAIGDGANDVSMLKLSDVAIAFGGIHAPAATAVSAAQLVVNDGEALCRLLRTL